MKCLHTIVFTSLGGLLLTLVPTAAYARSHTTPDPAHDVISQFEGGGGPVAVPTRAEGDVLASGVTHRPRRVIVAMRFAEMSTTTLEVGHQFRIRTNEGKVRIVSVGAGPQRLGGNTELTRGRGGEVRCRMTTALDYAQNRLTVSIPRRCLSSPRWVQVSFESLTMEYGNFYTDDGQSGAPLYWSGRPAFGPRVRRG